MRKTITLLTAVVLVALGAAFSGWIMANPGGRADAQDRVVQLPLALAPDQDAGVSGRAEPPRAISAANPDWKSTAAASASLEDGLVTQAEWEDGIDRFATCVEAKGVTLTGKPTPSAVREISYSYIGAEHDKVDSCYLAELFEVATQWTLQHPISGQEFLEAHLLLAECMSEYGIDVTADDVGTIAFESVIRDHFEEYAVCAPLYEEALRIPGLNN